MTGSQVTDRRATILKVLPVALADLGDGIAFGALAVTTGLSALAAVVMSAGAFSGTAQFAGLASFARRDSLPALFGTVAILNLRYLVMGSDVAAVLAGPGHWRLGHAMLLTDESWAIARHSSGRYDLAVLRVAGAMTFLAWIGGTALGALLGAFAGDPVTFGLDAAYPLFFLGLLVAQLTDRWTVAAALLGGGTALVLSPVVQPGVALLAAGAAGGVLGAVRKVGS